MDLRIRGRVAMVAAASKGIGKGVARSLLEEGCRLSICARDPQALEETKEELSGAVPGADVRTFSCDVAKPDELVGWHRQTIEELGAVEILVTNTGGPPAARFLALSGGRVAAGRGIDALERRPPAVSFCPP